MQPLVRSSSLPFPFTKGVTPGFILSTTTLTKPSGILWPCTFSPLIVTAVPTGVYESESNRTLAPTVQFDVCETLGFIQHNIHTVSHLSKRSCVSLCTRSYMYTWHAAWTFRVGVLCLGIRWLRRYTWNTMLCGIKESLLTKLVSIHYKAVSKPLKAIPTTPQP